jgi:hypothetical protein
MIQAAYQLEENLELPLASNPGVERYYDLVKSAGQKIPDNLMKNDHRWRLHMQKAALDRYYQLKSQRETELVTTAFLHLTDFSGSLVTAVNAAAEVLNQPFESQAMATLREEALQLAEESDQLFGVCNEGIRRTDLDLSGFNWIKDQLAKTLAATTEEERTRIFERMIHYEEAGEGGYYDDAGEEGRQPHLVEGENLWNPAQFVHLLDPKNRPSASSFVHNRQGPVRFAYDNLEPAVDYGLRVTLVTLKVTPELLARFGVTEGQIRRTQDILADNLLLAKDVEIPMFTAQQYEYQIPREATQDGKLEIRFDAKPQEGTFAASVVSELWLYRLR